MLNITDTDVYTALGAFIALCVPQGTTIMKGQQNRVAMPAGSCVVLTTLGEPERIGTNADGVTPVVVNGVLTGFSASVTTDYIYRVQADFYSPNAQAWATTAEMLWRDAIGIDSMPDGMKPLYTEGLAQIPIIGGEDQWIQRWTMTLVLDYQPTWTQPTQAATGVTVVPEPIDVFFSPGLTADSSVTADTNWPI